MPGLLKLPKQFLLKRALRAVSHASGRAIEPSAECPGDPYLTNTHEHMLSIMMETKCAWGFEVVKAISSSGTNDTERTQAVQRAISRGVSVVHTLLDFARVLGYKGLSKWTEEVLRSFILYYAGLDLKGVLIVNLKYHTLYISNRARGAPPPERKSTVESVDGWLLDYKFNRYVNRRAHRQDWVGETLLLGLKRGFPSMDERNVETEVKDLVQSLSTPGAPTPEFILREVRRTAREIWGDDLQPEVHSRLQYSDRAGFEKTAGVKVGGIRGHVWRWAISEGLAYNETQLEMFKWGPHCGLVRYDAGLIQLSYTHVWQGLYDAWVLADVKNYCVKRPTNCRVAIIYEPLKIRPITAGEAKRYALGKAFQLPLWKGLQKFNLFQLTGSPVSAAAITRQMSIAYPDEISAKSNVWGLELDRKWFRSGDFRGATNYIHADCTTAVLDAVVRREDYRRLCSDLVEAHEITYTLPQGSQGQESKPKKQSFLQQSGQLMGSMISFPILCCVNAAVLRLSLEASHKRKYNLCQIPGMINGDDILFRGSIADDEMWQALCPQVGFYESVGKSYISRDWVQINSRTFDMNLKQIPGMAIATKQRGFLNFGVIEGYEKGVNPQDEPSLEGMPLRLSGFWKEFEHLSVPGVEKRAKALALERLQERFYQAYKQGYIPYIPSFSNPVWAGGFGLFEAPFNVVAANKAMRWRWVKPAIAQYLYSPTGDREMDEPMQTEGTWDECGWKDLPTETAFVQWHEERKLQKYRD